MHHHSKEQQINVFIMRKIIPFSLLLLFTTLSFAQLAYSPVEWSHTTQKVSDTEYDLVFTANVNSGWYIYSQYLESDDGPIRTSFNFNKNEGVEFLGKTKEAGKKSEGYDALFDMNVIKYSGEVTFTQRVKITKGKPTLSGWLEFMTCDEERCLPPAEVDFKFKLE